MNKYFLGILVSFLFLVSCKPKEEQASHMFGPKVVEAHGYVVPKDSMAEPTVIQVDESKLKKFNTGKPKTILTNTNIFPAETPKVVTAGIPRICTPGQDTFSLPITIPAINKPVLAGIPEIVIAKDPIMKDQNPQNFSSFGKLQGLKSGTVRCLLQDHSGNLWLGTSGRGVSKYDGKTFTHFTETQGLTNNDVMSILEDHDGNLWFGTAGGGVSKYNGNTFTNFTQTEGLLNNFVWCILEDHNNNLWFGTNGGGVCKYDGKNFTNFTEAEGLSYNFVLSIIEDHEGNLWFGTDGFGVSKYDGQSFSNYTENEGLSSNYVFSMAEDQEGNIWFGTYGSVSKYDGKSFTQFKQTNVLSNIFVWSIMEDHENNLWFGTNGSGMSKFDGKSFTQFTQAEGLSNNTIWSILEDQAGNIWVGTDGGGINKYTGNIFTNVTKTEGLINNMVFSILEDHIGNLWFGTSSGGVSKYDGKSFTQFPLTSDILVFSIIEDHAGSIWFGTSSGVSKYDGNTATQITQYEGLINNYVYCMLEDHTGNLWFGTSMGVSKYNGKTFTQFTQNEGLSNNEIHCMLEDHTGNLWFGTYGGGLTKYDGKVFTHFTKAHGLSDNNISSIMEDHAGNLWFGTFSGGVNIYNGKTFTQFKVTEGLSSNGISSILEDHAGNIWIGTGFGLSELTKVKLTEILSLIGNEGLNKDISKSFKETDVYFKTYTYEDGFLGIGCNLSALIEDRNGTIWIGANDRLTAYHPPKVVQALDSSGPNIQVSAIALYNEPVAWAVLDQHKDSNVILGNGVQVHNFQCDGVTKWYGLPEHLSLAHNNNYLTFNFIGITMNQPQKVKYQYKLEGIDKNWSAITTRSEAPYGNLPPRNYVFKVKAMNSEGYWSNEFQYAFTIRPPWWKTWWAYSLYVLLVGSIVYTLYRNRIRQLENRQAAQMKTMVATQEEERKRISRDLHDDIGTKLSALKLFLSSLGEKASQTKNAEIKSLADSSEQFIKEAMQDVRQLLLNLSPSVLEEFGYAIAVEGLINKINETKQIHFNLVIFGIKQRLRKDYELALYRITQELINNVLKHAEAKHVSLQIGHRDGKLILMIEDDGKGFDINAHKDGYGLHNLDARTKLMHGTMAIDSHTGRGTSVLIEIPYHLN